MGGTHVLVTGAGGFIGRHLVRDQVGRGRRVRALDCRSQQLREDVEIVVGDVADVAVQRAAVAGVDVVFHLASAHLETSLPDTEYHRINVAAVESLLEESRRAGVQRFVHVSSCGVHGSVRNGIADEDAPFRPTNIYERTKAAGEQVVRDFYRRYGLSVVVVRPAWVYGPGCKRTARLLRSIANGKFMMIGRGANRRSAVYITDMLEALELCAMQQGIDGEVFIVAQEEAASVRELVDEMARLTGAKLRRVRIPLSLGWVTAGLVEFSARALGKQPPISRRTLKFFTNDADFSAAKARRMLGFEPQVSLRAGLELTYRWWRENGGDA
ncbi:MAG: NAD-dependent epimerase/dehydratase family protein [Gemmatimonadales bacterium]